MIYRKRKKRIKIITFCLSAIILLESVSVVQATNINDVKDQIKKDKNALNEIKGQISDWEDEQDLIEEEISDLDSELINTMTEIGLLEDNIEEKEKQLLESQTAYEEAKAKEEEQYGSMKIRIQYMYENGNVSYLSVLLEAGSISDLINRAEYVNSIYEYDRQLLTQYEESKKEVEKLRILIEEEKTKLEEDKGLLEEQSANLEQLVEAKKETSANYEAQIAKAKQEAVVYKEKLKQEEAELKKLEEEKRRQEAQENIDNIVVTKFDVSIIDSANGSELGKQIAKYACQFIGNPYVSGGTSLTNGADCSGFTYRIYRDFGYKIPRTSTQQRNAGTAVESLDQAQPGDLICYKGHVAMYVGGGYIVHASSKKTGIKIGRADYKTILAIRRII